MGNTLPDLEAPEDPASANITKDGTEETALLARGGQKVVLTLFPVKRRMTYSPARHRNPWVRTPLRGSLLWSWGHLLAPS